jgi:hypothetical protein
LAIVTARNKHPAYTPGAKESMSNIHVFSDFNKPISSNPADGYRGEASNTYNGLGSD